MAVVGASAWALARERIERTAAHLGAPPLAYNVGKGGAQGVRPRSGHRGRPTGSPCSHRDPGPVRTVMWEEQMAMATGMSAEAIVAGVPQQVGMVTGRMSEPEEVASVIAFLLSGRAENITGSDHLIDGGAIRSA